MAKSWHEGGGLGITRQGRLIGNQKTFYRQPLLTFINSSMHTTVHKRCGNWISKTCLGQPVCSLCGLLANAERGENFAEQVIGSEFARNFTELVMCRSQVFRQ